MTGINGKILELGIYQSLQQLILVMVLLFHANGKAQSSLLILPIGCRYQNRQKNNAMKQDQKTDDIHGFDYIDSLRAQVDNLNGTLDHMREFLLYYSKEKLPDYDDNGKIKTIRQLCDEWHIRLTNK